jgi:hypothetical protein
MAIPKFRDDGWLPEGHHPAQWEEVIAVFGGQPGSRRAQILSKLLSWRDEARQRGISGRLILDGSFISAKETPGDFDALLIYDEHVEAILAQDAEARALLDHDRCKEKGFDLFVFSAAAARKFPEWTHLDMFDRDKVTGRRKGVLEVIL